ncbi:unnamed protein product [Prorocentrum cordatum]|uniref:Uncharacterized protein n=1 Tax=Prorocentrum cordatum TaxID=2364126 RepID=A0ABN9X6D4_9DINO|nr:unnamed protein product [Polarella glacialis]
MTSEQENFLLESIAKANVDEHELPEALATLSDERKKTWNDNRDYKRQLRVDRKFHQTPGASGSRPSAPAPPPPGKRDGHRRNAKGVVRGRKKRLPVDKLVKVAKCSNVHKEGHWGRECPERRGRGQTTSAPPGGREPAPGSVLLGPP